MALGFREAVTGEKSDFNKLSAEEKAKFVKERGWFDERSLRAVVNFEVFCYIGGQLESRHEFFEWALRSEPTSEELDVPGLPINLYCNNGVKLRAREYSAGSGETFRDFDLSIGEPIEFSREKYIPFKETYRVILKDVKYGEMLDL